MTLTVPEFLRPWLGSSPLTVLLLCVGLALLGIAAAVGLWFGLAPGPRRRRAFRRAQRLLQQGNWQSALEIARRLQGAGRLSAAWRGRLANLEGECHRAAGDAAK